MTHPHSSNRGRQAGRRCAGVIVLILVLGLSGAGTIQADRFPEDPVEKFKQALIAESTYRSTVKIRLDLEKDAAERKRLENTYKNILDAHEKRLTDAEKGLTNVAQLSQALFLLDWPGRGSTLDREDKWTAIDDKIRAQMKKRLVDETTQGIKNGSASRQIALCNLTAESVVTSEDPSQEGRQDIIADLAKLVDPLKELLKTTSNEDVRVAAAAALGNYAREADQITPALKAILADPKTYPDKSRQAAAEALVSLIQHLTGEDIIRASEPGVTQRDSKRMRLEQLSRIAPPPGSRPSEVEESKMREAKSSFRSTLGVIAAALPPAAAEGARDSSAAVRRLSVSALRQTVGAMANEVRVMKGNQTPKELTASSRDRDRTWTGVERSAAAADRKEVEASLEGFKAGLTAFTSKEVLNALLRDLRDPDPGTRLEARRTLDELSRLRRFLIEFDNLNPPDGKEPVKKPAGKLAGRTARVNRGTSESIILAADSTMAPDRLGVSRLRRQKKEADALGAMLLELGENIVRSGTSDPNPKARLATVEATESLGPIALPFTPRLVTALGDSDLFVRWVAARTLEKLAPTIEKEAPDKTPAIVAGLISMLDDDDLDPRTAAASALGAYGPAAKSAVGPLTRKLEKGDADFRTVVMKALEGIGTDSAPALPELVKLFSDPDQRIRAEAARVVGRFGIAAKKYLPDLQKLIDDLDLDVRNAATASVLAITRAH